MITSKIEQFKHINMMRDPSQWPLGKVLPLVRRGEHDDELPREAFLVAAHGKTVNIIYYGNVFLSSRVNESQKIFHQFQEVIDEGWEVD